jgi:hypothetical protein
VIDTTTGATITTQPLVESAAWIDREHLVCAIESSTYQGEALRVLDLAARGSLDDGPSLATVDGIVDSLEVGVDGVLVTTSSMVRAAYSTPLDATAPRQLSDLTPIETGGAEVMIAAGWTDHEEPILAVIQGGQRSFVRVRADRGLDVLARPTAGLTVSPMTGTILPYFVREDAHTLAKHFLDTASGVDRVWQRVSVGTDARVRCARGRPICVLQQGRYATQLLDPRTGELGARLQIDLGAHSESLSMSVSFDGSELAITNPEKGLIDVLRLADAHVTSIEPSPAIALDPNDRIELGADGDMLLVSTTEDASTLYRMSRDGHARPLVVAPYHQLRYPVLSAHGQVLFTGEEARETVSFLPFQ